MKNVEIIQEQIRSLKNKQRIVEVEHNRLDQISMLSGEGNMKREKINKIKGMIKALEWVLNDNITGSLYE